MPHTDINTMSNTSTSVAISHRNILSSAFSHMKWVIHKE